VIATKRSRARRVSHRNVCRIHEYGEEESRRFISMEYVDGTDLRQILRERGAFPPDGAFDVAIQMVKGLEAVHEEGIVHRDLEATNIMRDVRGVVKLMDFGIAKRAGGDATAGGGADTCPDRDAHTDLPRASSRCSTSRSWRSRSPRANVAPDDS